MMSDRKLLGGKSLSDIARASEPAEKQEGSGEEGERSRSPRFAAAGIVARGSAVAMAERRTLIKVDPKRCKVWANHDRDLVWFTPESCADLIGSIRQNGQKEAAVARRISGDHEYELITGARRRYACEVLGIDLLVEVAQISDEEAAVRMHIENSDREDLSPMERAISCARLIKSGVFSTQEALAGKLQLSLPHVSKMIRAATVLDVAALRRLFPDVREMPLADSYQLALILESDATRTIVVKAAEQLERSGSYKGKSASALIKQLIAAPSRSSLSSVFKKDYNVGKQGRVAVTRNAKGKVTLSFPKGITPDNRGEVLEAIKIIVGDLAPGSLSS